jgi:hypothetical protein
LTDPGPAGAGARRGRGYSERLLNTTLPPIGDPEPVARDVLDRAAGFGALQRHLDDPEIDIWVNESGRDAARPKAGPAWPIGGGPAHQSCEGHMTVPLPPGLKPGTKVSHYRIEKLIARGGMGLVYLATDLRLERRVALKMLAPELSDDASFRDRFMRESRLAAAVDHPNIIPIHEAGDWNGLLFIAMRYVEGVDLHTALAVSGPPETATAISLLAQAVPTRSTPHNRAAYRTAT